MRKYNDVISESREDFFRELKILRPCQVQRNQLLSLAYSPYYLLIVVQLFVANQKYIYNSHPHSNTNK